MGQRQDRNAYLFALRREWNVVALGVSSRLEWTGPNQPIVRR